MISVCFFVQNSFTQRRQRQFINELIFLLNNQAALHGIAETKAKDSATCSDLIHQFKCYSHTEKYH